MDSPPSSPITAEVEKELALSLKLLHSKKEDSTEMIWNLLNNAIIARYGTDKSLSKTIVAKTEKKYASRGSYSKVNAKKKVNVDKTVEESLKNCKYKRRRREFSGLIVSSHTQKQKPNQDPSESPLQQDIDTYLDSYKVECEPNSEEEERYIKIKSGRKKKSNNKLNPLKSTNKQLPMLTLKSNEKNLRRKSIIEHSKNEVFHRSNMLPTRKRNCEVINEKNEKKIRSFQNRNVDNFMEQKSPEGIVISIPEDADITSSLPIDMVFALEEGNLPDKMNFDFDILEKKPLETLNEKPYRYNSAENKMYKAIEEQFHSDEECELAEVMANRTDDQKTKDTQTTNVKQNNSRDRTHLCVDSATRRFENNGRLLNMRNKCLEANVPNKEVNKVLQESGLNHRKETLDGKLLSFIVNTEKIHEENDNIIISSAEHKKQDKTKFLSPQNPELNQNSSSIKYGTNKKNTHQIYQSEVRAGKLLVSQPHKVKRRYNTVCFICQRGRPQNPKPVIKCDDCKRSFHGRCHNPPIDTESVLNTKWYCSVCTI